MFAPFVTFNNDEPEDYFDNSVVGKLYKKNTIQDYLQGLMFNSPDGIPVVVQPQQEKEENKMIDDRGNYYSQELDLEEDSKKKSTKKTNLITKQQVLANGSKVINSLIDRLGMTREQAAGVAGVIMAESGLNPASYNKAEKAGTLKGSKANGAGYGAGMLQWSMGRKDAVLKLIGKNKPIEELSIDDQIDMLIGELQGPYKNTLEGILQCKTPSEAAATMYCHNVGGLSSSRLPATQAEIDAMNKRYSKFAKNQINKGMDYAEELFQKIGQ